MREISCCFTGHRQLESADDEAVIKKKLANQVKKFVDMGIKQFYCGGATGFDTLAAMCVLELKKSRKDILLTMALPCKSQSKYFNKYQKQLYNFILESADNVIYTSVKYTPYCMYERNRYMVDNSSCCICYLRKHTGGTSYTVRYARESGLDVIYI